MSAGIRDDAGELRIGAGQWQQRGTIMWLEQAKLDWERLGEADPMWAILSDPELTGNRWDRETFFNTGLEEVGHNLRYVMSLGLEIPRDRCLDFGCGVGRLTQALCDYFDRCDGVDIAASMVEGARTFNRHGIRCHYHVNSTGDLRLFEDAQFTFVLSIITLQHIEPLYSKRYVSEFMRVLRPGGIAVFQIPTAVRKAGEGPLPPGAHQAVISAGEVPARMVAGEPIEVSVEVRNVSRVEWPNVDQLRVGNHWCTRRGVAVLDDGRATLPRSLAPGEEATVRVKVTPPLSAGTYELQFDLVEEGVTWFASQGSKPARVPVRVESGESASGKLFRKLGLKPVAVARNDMLPVAEMHCVPEADVRAVVAAAGGEIVDVAPYNVTGPIYESLRYVAVRL
ncbi:methyltransferase domain-containing protein [Candidatus Nephthysia bennettiae]|uniref:Methyltransferase domain-containing protein n=1 Tax=Candidatus Nephthysia bennettiae TaxID=3127016 RepID=A0A934N2S7_9BACT|nr:methyltransferase domain-containing protein [Candidatus Dormibacteraeota bacterium]MBJ7613838.1 methyltransferase domain-containing protein [Candidatus Dormibacteraeota bacterium]